MNPWKEERFAVWFVGLAPLIAGLMLTFGENGAIWALPAMAAVGMAAAAIMGRSYPWLKWTQSGIHYRFLLKTRYIAWSELLQAGITCEKAKKAGGVVVCRNCIVLLLPGAAPKSPDGPFLMRANRRHILRLPNLPEYRTLVESCCGPLSFDESVKPGLGVTVYNKL